MIPQFRLATRLAKEGRKEEKGVKASLNRDVDLPLSVEITDMLRDTFEYKGADEVREDVASILTVPMDSVSTLCPTASLLMSETAAARIPYGRTEFTGTRLDSLTASNQSNNKNNKDSLKLMRGSGSLSPEDFSLSFPASPGEALGASLTRGAELATGSGPILDEHGGDFIKPTAFSQAKERFQVLWLQRKAQIDRESGDTESALKALDDALTLHLGGHNVSYDDANLGEPVETRRPEELLEEMEENFLPYDKTPHMAAIKIQSSYAKFHRYRCSAATFIQKHYRGRLGCKRYMRTFNLRTHCASLIQILFKHHLYHKIHPLATKLKRWYFMRVQMRDYAQRIFMYRRARRIQRLWRGNKGRARFKYINDKLQGARRTQRNWRAGSYVRGQRLFGIQLIHKLFFQAAKKIQHRYRYLLAIKRTQQRLIATLVGEEERYKEERSIYDETIEVEVARNRFYMRTHAGRMHVADARHKIRLKDVAFDEMKADLEPEEILAHKAMVTFECFDSDGSGQIDVTELGLMLRELSIPMSHEDVVNLANEIDESGDGEIDFAEFLEWYSGGGDQDKENGVGDALFRQMLKARHFLMEVTGQILTKRSEREVLRQLTSYLSHDTIVAFRLKQPPKYQCCQCCKPFALFTDYISHFDENGCCLQNKEKALFFPNYWDQTDWVKQRDVEYEVMRVHDEYPYVNFKATKAIFADLALMDDLGVQIMMNHHIESATDMFLEKLMNPKNKLKLSQFVIAAVDIGDEKVLPPYIAKRVASLLGASLPVEWIRDDEWDLAEFEKWLQLHLDDQSKQLRERASSLKFCVSEKMLLRHEAHLVGKLYVHTLRQIQAYTEASLVALMEFRKRRPRRIRLSDHLLTQIGREDLSATTYHETKNIILVRLKLVQAAMRHLLTLTLNRVSRCEKLTSYLYIPGLCQPPQKKGDYAAIGPGEDISDEEMGRLLIREAHIRAEAKQQARLLSRVGRSYIRRLANEMWAKEFNMHAKLKEGSLSTWETWRLGRDLYLFDIYAAKYHGEMVVDLPDMDALEMSRSILVRDKNHDEVYGILFPENAEKVSYRTFMGWYKTEGFKGHWNMYRVIRNALLICINRLLFRSYAHDARMRSYMNARKIARLDLDISRKCISMLVDVNKEETPEQIAEKQKIAAAADITKKALKELEASERSHKRARLDLAQNKKTLEDMEEVNKNKLEFAETTASTFEEACRNRDQARGGDPELFKKLEKDAKLARTEATKAKKDFDKYKTTLDTQAEATELAKQKESVTSEAREKSQKEFDKAQKAENEIRTEIETLHAQQAEEQARIVEAMEANVNDLQMQLQDATNEEVRGEERLLFRLTEDDAERQCWIDLFSKTGLYRLATERLLMGMSIKVVEAYGHLIPRGARSPTSLRWRRGLSRFLDVVIGPKNNPLVLEHGLQTNSESASEASPLKPSSVTITVHRRDMHASEHARGWDLAMGILVHTFDTDCSGTFDEGEVRLLLQCIKCGLSERRLLANFPEVIDDSTDLAKVVEYAAKRVIWRRGIFGPLGNSGALRIDMRSRTAASLMMLISLSRQRAREFAEKAANLKNVMLGAPPVEEDDVQDSAATITRAQLLAMRQVKMYLRTNQSVFERKAEYPRLKHWWKMDVQALRGSKEGLLRYAYQLHREWKGLLVTEIPHLVAYVVKRFGLKTNDQVEDVSRIMVLIHGVDDLRWLSMQEALDLLMPVFEDSPEGGIALALWQLRHVRRNIRSDTKVNMYARARQQAVLVALNYPNMRVAATNYRCSALGLDVVIRANAAKSWWTKRKELRKQRTKGITVNFMEVPRETIATLLLSRGYMMEDMTKPIIYDVVNVGGAESELAMDVIDVGVAIQTAREGAKLFTRTQRTLRWLKFFNPLGILRYYEYGMMVRTLALHNNDVRAQGAIFLKELLSGISHCIAEIEE